MARTLTKAFASSLDYAYTAIHERAALRYVRMPPSDVLITKSTTSGRYILPWLEFHVEETKAALCRDGENRWWQDGLTDQNRRTLDKFLEYSHNQGLSKRRWEVEDLFAKSSLEAFVV